jgi:transglutaminase superfamily protein
MSKNSVLRRVQNAPAAHRTSPAMDTSIKGPVEVRRMPVRHRYFRAIWYSGNILLILAILLAIYSVMWEYSTRRYLKGFSDAVVPESSSAVDKVEAILNWMSRGPARQESDQIVTAPDRDPTDTLNYASLLEVCGSATNAFINLADSAGLTARRLLLLDSRRLTTHVVAEVLIDGRWIVIDPAFRMIPRGSGGRLLTREDLMDPAVLSAATRGVPGYSPDYTFDRAVHIRVSRLRYVGLPLRMALDRLIPGWEDSAAASLLLERESLATMVVALTAVFLLAILRVALRWYGERRLGIRPVRIRQQVRRAFYAFVDTAG